MTQAQKRSRRASTPTPDPMFNQSVEKAFAVLAVFSVEKSALKLAGSPLLRASLPVLRCAPSTRWYLSAIWCGTTACTPGFSHHAP